MQDFFFCALPRVIFVLGWAMGGCRTAAVEPFFSVIFFFFFFSFLFFSLDGLENMDRGEIRAPEDFQALKILPDYRTGRLIGVDRGMRTDTKSILHFFSPIPLQCRRCVIRADNE